MKTCNKCKLEKELNQFNKSQYYCKSCQSENYKKWRIDNKDKEIERSKLFRETNPDYFKNHYYENHEKEIERSRNKYNKDYHREYKKKRLQDDVLFKFNCNLRSLIKISIKRNGYTKNSSTFEVLGCSYNDFKLHLESKFEPWMNWQNYGKYNGELNYGWDIDHIIPISSATNEEEVLKLNHYTNLQPLCSKINRDIKKDKLNYV